MSPLVSVVVPVYNVENYVADSLRSICNQSFRNLEIIIVYTKSSDNSIAVCEEFARQDPRITIVSEDKQGLGVARDKGISIAQGEWICFLDSDDYVHSDFVKILLNAVLKYECLTAHCRFEKVCGCKAESDVGKGDVTLLDWEKYFCYLYTHQSEGHSPFGAWANIYHRSLFEHVSFGELRYAEDSAFAPRIIYAARHRPIAVIDRVLYYYLQREGSLLHQTPSLIRMDQFRAKKIALDFFESVGANNMYHLFYPVYCSCLMNDYIDLAMYLPEKKNEYQILHDTFIKELPVMKEYCFPYLGLHPHAQFAWEMIWDKKDEIILYGCGLIGKRILDRLRYFGINIKEIWDNKFKEAKEIDGIPCRQMHGGISKDYLILIAIADLGAEHEARIDLSNLGYKNFMGSSAVIEALKLARIKKFFPEVLEMLKQNIEA